ncbi:MAG: adenylate kinase [Candidatus ainarchaeum sp.]|nr:adenylate kinase [Candidatus ainarchaeum sp.]
MSLNLIFLGPPGAGKGTVAQAVIEKYNLFQISTGDLVREEVKKETTLGKEIENIINSGKLVNDDLISLMLETKLKQIIESKKYNGIILDGFPRTIPQADKLDEILKKINQKLDGVIYIESSEENIVKRLNGRWTCQKCKKVYNSLTIPEKNKGFCDDDNEKLIQRDDDKEETIRKRYQTFIEKTMPLIEYYSKKGLLKKYDGNVAPKQSIEKAIEKIEEIKNKK